MIYYVKRVQSKVSTGKRHRGRDQGTPGGSFQNPLQVELHRPCLSPQQGPVTTHVREQSGETYFFNTSGHRVVNTERVQ